LLVEVLVDLLLVLLLVAGAVDGHLPELALQEMDLPEQQTPEVAVVAQHLQGLPVLAVLASSLFNIQNKEVKYGTLCTDWL
jgi:hypothetical protein